jgi:hypothetical protein
MSDLQSDVAHRICTARIAAFGFVSRAGTCQLSADPPQNRASMQGDVIGLVAPDFVLRIIRATAMGVPLVVDVARVDFLDTASHLARLGVPAYMVTHLELMGHA